MKPWPWWTYLIPGVLGLMLGIEREIRGVESGTIWLSIGCLWCALALIRRDSDR